MANGVYNRGKYLIADGALDLPTTADLRVLLVKSTYQGRVRHAGAVRVGKRLYYVEV